MARYIDADALIAEYDRVHVGAPGGARKLMVDAPTVDVVEVVRCKDCKHFAKSKEAPVTYCNRELKSMWVKPNDYCSYGERSGGNDCTLP